MNPPVNPILWDVRVRATGRSRSVRARTAWAAWSAVAPRLGNPAFGDVECTPRSEPPIDTTPPIVLDIVAALATPTTLSGIRNRVRNLNRKSITIADVLLAVSSGAIEWDHLAQRYRRTT